MGRACRSHLLPHSCRDAGAARPRADHGHQCGGPGAHHASFKGTGLQEEDRSGVAGIGGNVLAVVLAWQGWGVWSLVWGQMLDACLRNGVVWLVCPWRPRWRFNPRIGRELFNYGKHIVGSQLLIFGITNIDDAFVGRMLGSGPLGHYGLAYKVSNLPATNIKTRRTACAPRIFA